MTDAEPTGYPVDSPDLRKEFDKMLDNTVVQENIKSTEKLLNTFVDYMKHHFKT